MKRFLIVLMLYAITISAIGQVVSINEARENVETFLRHQTTTVSIPAQFNCAKNAWPQSLILAYSTPGSEAPMLYAFNISGGGFVVAGGDKAAEEILAYSNTGTFDIDNISPGLQYWIKQYEQQIEYARTTATASVPAQFNCANTAWQHNRTTVDILLKTHWNQDTPYNTMCPTEEKGTKSEQCLTGCVATAMAQVMKYHEWPEEGNGSHTYFDSYAQVTREGEFEGHRYDWGNMLETYTNTSTEEQKNAVGLLMSDAGLSVDMTYSADGSGAWPENVAYALVNYFGYDKGATFIYRDYISDTEWENLIYQELSEGRPIIMAGALLSGASHCFVCDGYDAETDKYHFNWGWGGTDDCYCALSAVTARTYKLYYQQEAITGIQPPTETTTPPVDIIAEYGNLEYEQSEKDGLVSYSFQFSENLLGKEICYMVYNISHRDVDVVFTTKYTNEQTGETYYAKPTDLEANVYSFKSIYPMQEDEEGYAVITGYKNIEVGNLDISHIPSGTYRMTLAYTDLLSWNKESNESWKEVGTYSSYQNYIITQIENTTSIKSLTSNLSTLTSDTYNITGQPVDSHYKGVVIKNGKKVLQ